MNKHDVQTKHAMPLMTDETGRRYVLHSHQVVGWMKRYEDGVCRLTSFSKVPTWAAKA